MPFGNSGGQGWNSYAPIVKSDTVPDPATTPDEYAGFYVGDTAVGTSITLVRRNGTTCSFVGVIAGHVYEFPFVRINVTGSQADAIVGLRR